MEFAGLPKDIKIYIMGFIEDDLELINLCRQTEGYCSDNFILNRLYNKFGITPEEANKVRGNTSYIEYYASLVATTRDSLASYYVAQTLRDRRTDLAKVAIQIGTPKLLEEMLTAVSINGHADLLKLILRKLPDIRKPLLGYHLYLNSGYNNNSNIINVLLDAGADVNYVDGVAKETSLMSAIRSGHTNIAKILIDRGADIHANNDLAFRLAHYSPEILALLNMAV